MQGKNPKVTQSKDKTESQIESAKNGNTECHDKFLEWTKKANSKHFQATH